MCYDLGPIVSWIVEEFEPAVRVDGMAGRYARRVGDARAELYGLADMACILHTVGRLTPDEATLARWRGELADLQDPDTGYILERDPTHCPLHNTAFALGAMHLLGQRPLGPLRFAADYDTPAKLRAFLDGLDWRDGVYPCSHAGAGLASALALVGGMVGPEWFDAYFDDLDGRFDASHGMLGEGKAASGDTDALGGTFHYAFLYEHFGRPMPHPAARVDAVLALQRADGLWHDRNTWWLTLDAVYLLSRAVRDSRHRGDEAAEAVRRALDNRYCILRDQARRQEEFYGRMGVHLLTAAVSLFAEAQQFLGADEVITAEPLRLVLDERPFI